MVFMTTEGMPDRCHPGVTLGILYSEWILVWSSGIGISEWNIWSSGLHSKVVSVGIFSWPLNVFDFRAVSLGRASRSGLRPYPRYMSLSLAPEWIEVRVKKG